MVYWTPDPRYIKRSTYGILTPYRWYIKPPAYGILTPLSMVYRTSYQWYIEPPTQGILNHLPRVYRIPCPLHIEPLPMVSRNPYTRHIGPPLMVLWTTIFVFKIPYCIYIEPGVKIPYCILNPGSKYLMVYWTRGFFRGSKNHTTPDQLRDIYSIYRCFWNVAIHVTCLRLKQQVHTNSLNILGTVVIVW